MLNPEQKDKVLVVWKTYVGCGRRTLDVKGRPFEDIDASRKEAASRLREYVSDFLAGKTDVGGFKTLVDSFNKRNNFWGFTAIKGQMFFNQLANSAGEAREELSSVLRSCMAEPSGDGDAETWMNTLEKYCRRYFDPAPDKRKVPNPGSVPYFLSYFWQLYDPDRWPIQYTSLTESFTALGVWNDAPSRGKSYVRFLTLNREIVRIIGETEKAKISFWDVEHAFWNFRGKIVKPKTKENRRTSADKPAFEPVRPDSFAVPEGLFDYVIPKVASLVELGASRDRSSAGKGFAFEKMVAETFRLLEFDVEELGQGTGRNPDAILRYRPGNTAFLVDAKAYSDGYDMGLDDRAIKEYVNHFCPILRKDGYERVGFIIVSNSFKSDMDEFANDITWNTDLKRFVLLGSDALLALLAYKTKGRLGVEQVISCIVSLGNPIDASKIAAEFEDV